MDDTYSMLMIGTLFGVDRIENLLEISSLCDPSLNGNPKRGKNTLDTFFIDRDAFVKRDLAVIHQHGADYYFSTHAKAFIGMLPEEDLKNLRVALKWGANEDTTKKNLYKLFEKCRLFSLTVNKEKFIYHALRRGYNLEHEARGINYQLVNIIKSKIDVDAAEAKQPTAQVSPIPSLTKEAAFLLTEKELLRTREKSDLWYILQVGMLSLEGRGYTRICNELDREEKWARVRREKYIKHMQSCCGVDVKPLMPKQKRAG